jgi:guanine nucleotide-binding protein G(i) subunit alpha
MGNCASTYDDHGATAHSAAIDRQIEEDARVFRKECKILLLGKSLSFNPS